MQVQQLGRHVNTFLESIGRNSKGTQQTYEFGLLTFYKFLNNTGNSLEGIVQLLLDKEIDVYELLNQFVSYLFQRNISALTLKLYICAVRSYLGYCDIDIVPSKFKHRVKLPKHHREDELPLDVGDVRNLLLKCINRRLKVYLLVLASSGLRAVEACAIRYMDIDFTSSPTRIHVRKEYAKTRVSRYVYISDESTDYLRQLLDWKYRNKEPQQDDLVFSIYDVKTTPKNLYFKILTQFLRLQKVAGGEMEARKDNSKRHKITLQSFRRFVKGVLSDQVNPDYSEMILGHGNRSVYYTKKEAERREIYKIKCMKYLTFLDYSLFETQGKNLEARLSEKEQEIQLLRQGDAMNTDAISALSDQLSHVMKEIELLKQERI